MDHIVEDFDLPLSDLPTVRNWTDVDDAPPDSWEKFQNYPRDHGWAIEEDNLSLKLISGVHTTTVDELKFLQSWLFFGLIMTIVQIDGSPILRYEQLIEDQENGEQRVTTKELPGALREWKDWETERKNTSDVRLRMVRAESVLDAARRIIRAKYSHDGKDDGESGSENDSVPLSFMILGETLSMTKAQIMKLTGSRLKGWHSDDDNGWGPPSYVFHKMKEGDWCKRTISLWWSQLRGNATLMLASYFMYRSLHRFNGIQHGGCTEQKCTVMPHDDQENYKSAHAYGCSSRNTCTMQGPDMAAVRKCLQQGRIPLLHFEYKPSDGDSPEKLVLEVQKKPPSDSDPIKYATISHVWSDGFGNENDNAMHHCQLRYIRSILDKLDPVQGWKTPFWMDTLIIPVGTDKDDKTLRKRAIKQIFEVFKESAYTIVLDAGLSKMNPGRPERPAVAAMRILGSSWMRRLWTLQEAFLSRKIYFAFENSGSKNHLQELNKLTEKLGSDKDAEVTTSLLNMVNRHLQNLVMSHEYTTRENYLYKRRKGGLNKEMTQKKAAMLVASSWKAARWRTTSNEYHETLALATLLDLDYENTEIADVGLQQPKSTEESSEEINSKKDDLAKQFWTQFNSSWPNSIPPGIIFLPGERVRLAGFGWAPRTWMTAQAVDHPDPLSFMMSTAELVTTSEPRLNGLKVKYPGFLLDPQNRGDILGTNASQPRFWFPTGPTFLDWYVVEFTPEKAIKNFLTRVIESRTRLGIIISRTSPGDSPAEVGLLVQIREPQTLEPASAEAPSSSADGVEEHDPPSRLSLSSDYDQADIDGTPLYCEVLGRVKVSRETRAEFRTRNRARYWFTDDHVSKGGKPDNVHSNGNSNQARTGPVIPQVMISSGPEKERVCLAEELGPEQVWVVDGYFPTQNIEEAQDDIPDTTLSPSSNWSFLNPLRWQQGQPASSNPIEASDPNPPRRAETMGVRSADPQPESRLRSRLARRFTFGLL